MIYNTSTVYIKALGMSRKYHRTIRYRITIGKFSTVFYGTQKELAAFVDSVRDILQGME
jgi:hypothetical protein